MEFAYQQEDKEIDVEALAREVQQVSNLKAGCFLSNALPTLRSGLQTLSQDTGLEMLQQLYPACAEVWLTFIKYRERNGPSPSAGGYGILEHLSRASTKLREWKSSKLEQPATKSGPKAKTKSKAPKRTPKATPAAAPQKRSRALAKGLTKAEIKDHPEEPNPLVEGILRQERESAFTLLGIPCVNPL